MNALSNSEPLIRYRRDVAQRFVSSLKANQVRLCVLLPDAILHPVNEIILGDTDVRAIMCSREDEGIAIAMGSYWAGMRSAIMMEGSGIGLSGNIIGRAMLQRSPTFMVVSHNSVFGEMQSYHAATRTIVEPVLNALRVPFHVLRHADELEEVTSQLVATMVGQRLPVALVVPRHIFISN